MPRIVFDPPKSRLSRRSLWLGFRMGFETFYESISFLVDAAIDGINQEMSNRHVTSFWQRLLRVSHTQLCVGGLSHIDPNVSYVYMSNHQSVMDIPVMLGAVPQPMRMVAKEILFKVPLFGAAMRGCGFIPIDRKRLGKAKKQLEQANSRLQEGVSVWVAPEGTRSRSLELLPFKKGGFLVALGLGVPIVPVWVHGAAEVLPSDSMLVRPNQTILVSLGQPIPTAHLSVSDLPELMQQVRKAMLDLTI